ncbi:MAG: hypothetical protein ACREXY_07715 [Gammaproteobacteria bacterium]
MEVPKTKLTDCFIEPRMNDREIQPILGRESELLLYQFHCFCVVRGQIQRRGQGVKKCSYPKGISRPVDEMQLRKCGLNRLRYTTAHSGSPHEPKNLKPKDPIGCVLLGGLELL